MIKLFISFILFLPTVLNGQNRYIPDIAPVDVYLNLEGKGFSTEKDLGSEFGNFWTCTLNQDGIEYKVEISSKDVNRVQSIRATVLNVNINPKTAKQFFKYLSSVLFLYSETGETNLKNWIDNNFNNHGATTETKGAEIKINSPSQLIKILFIDSDLSDGI